MNDFANLYRIECDKANKQVEAWLKEAADYSVLEKLPNDSSGHAIRLARELGYVTGILRRVMYDAACQKAIESSRCLSVQSVV